MTRAIPILLFVCVSCGGRQSGVTAASKRCTQLTTDLDTVQTSKLNVDLKANLQGSDEQIGGVAGDLGWNRETATRVKTGMDAFSSDHARIRTALCDDIEFKRITMDDFSRRAECLDSWLQRMRTAVQAAVQPGASGEQVLQMFVEATQAPACQGE